MIKQYIRDEHRNPVGVIVAIGRNQFGWSFCHSSTTNSKGDRWNKTIGIDLAVSRASNNEASFIPKKHRSEFGYTFSMVIRRAYKYFKE
jgi:hypothetical protein